MFRDILVNIIGVLPPKLVRVFSQKYIAGNKLDDALHVSHKLNNRGVEVTIDLLGEFQDDIEAIESNFRQYIEIITRASEHDLQTTFSVKPTMFGLLSAPDICFDKLEQLIQLAAERGRMIRLDMEDSNCTDKEIVLFLKLYAKYPANVALVLQAYLRRTLNDLKHLAAHMNSEYPINIRLCKGIYNEPEKLAYKAHDEINVNYEDCLRFMMENRFYCSIATHDNRLLKSALSYLDTYEYEKYLYEFQMLYGVKAKMRDELVRQGHRMRVYVPFGEHWYAYSIRRLKENPQVAMHIIKSLLFLD